MFSFFKRKKATKDTFKEPKRPPRKSDMGANQNSKIITQNEVYKTPPETPILTLKSNNETRRDDNKTVPKSNINIATPPASGSYVLSSGDLVDDDEGDSEARNPPNNVNNVVDVLQLPSRPTILNMGNNISKPEGNIDDKGDQDDDDEDLTATATTSSITTTAIATTSRSNQKDDEIEKLTTAPSIRQQSVHQQLQQHQQQNVSESIIMDTTNLNKTNLISLNKTEDSNLNIQKDEEIAFITSGNLKLNNKNNIDNKFDQPNISKYKNSDLNKIIPSTCKALDEIGIVASKSNSLEFKNTNNLNARSTKKCNNINRNEENFELIDTKSNLVIPIDSKHNNSKENELLNVNKQEINDKLQTNENNINDTEVSLLVKETREVICLTGKVDLTKKKYDTLENNNANMIINSKSSEQCIDNSDNKTAVNQMLIEPQEDVVVPTIITEVICDVNVEPTNSKTSAENNMIICQNDISVNNEQCTVKDSEDTIENKEMLSIRSTTSNIETFSSSPPKVNKIDSELEEYDNTTNTEEFLINDNNCLKEKDLIDNRNVRKMKKHVHWADSEEGRNLESFEQCSSSSSSDEDNVDEEEENNFDEGINKNKQSNETSSDEEEESSSEDEDNDNNDDESSSSSIEEEIIIRSKEKSIPTTYKRQDTWIDMTEDCSNCNSDASEQQHKKQSVKLHTTTDNDDENSGEEETSDENEEESSSTDNDEDDDKKTEQANDNKTDSIVRNVELNSSSLIPVHELYEKITRLQEEIMIKASGLERQHAELEAAYLESESMKQKSKQLEEELYEYRCRNTELALRICNAESKLLSEGDKEKLNEAEKKIVELESELYKVKQEKQKLEEAINRLEKERDQEVQIIRQALDDALSEQETMEARYKKEFEQLRSLNSNREVQMLDDFEWKLREVEKLGKKKLADTEKELTEKVKDLTTKLNKAEEELSQVAHLKLCEIELKQLRATAHEHRKNLRTVTRQLEDLQVDEKILQEEVNRLRVAVDREKAQIIALQNSHKEEMVEKDRKTQFKLQTQKNQINSEWEEKLKRECSRLKSDLEKGFREEKMVAIETEKRIREHEITNHRQIWEKKLEDIKSEINNYKKRLEEKEEKHKVELERAQTHSDRDVMDLRRKLDKLDMQYQEKIEKMQEAHEQQISAVKQDCERKIHQCESSAQLHLGTTRTTLELVKQQMANECEKRIEQLKRLHQDQLDDQWEKMQLKKELEIQQLEEEHKKALELLEKKLEEYKKRNKSSEVVTPSLKKQSSSDSGGLAVHSREEDKPTNKEQMSSRHERMLGFEMPSNSQPVGSPVEVELRKTVEKLTNQVYEDRLEIQRLREQLSEKMYPRQQPQQRPQQSQPHPQQQHHRRSRKSRSGKN